MSAFRDSNSTLLQHITRLERENARLRRDTRTRRRSAIRKINRLVLQVIAGIGVISAGIVLSIIIAGVACAAIAILIAFV